jgi:hypothetical protein
MKMKISFFNPRSLWFLMLLSLVMVGCAGGSKSVSEKKSPDTQTAPYPAIVIEESIPLIPEKGEGGPTLELSMTLLDPAGEGLIQDPLLQDLLYGGKTPQEYAAALILDYQNFYDEAYTSLPGDGADVPASMTAWTYGEDHRVQRKPPLMVVDRTKEYFTGGAHGMREQEYFVIDSEEKRRLFLEDLFLESAGTSLKALMEDALRDYSKLSPGEPLSEGYYFDNSVDIPENFFLSPEGVGFHWDPYEIAPYSAGPIEVVVPYNKLQGLLTPKGISLLSQFESF